jgi:hypothetical protein
MNVYAGLIFCLIIFLHVSSVFAANVTLAWDPPSTNTDGTPLTDLGGYIVYYGTESGNYSQSIDVGNVNTYKVNSLIAGLTYYFSVTSYKTSGNESNYSNEIYAATPSITSPAPESTLSCGDVTFTWTKGTTPVTQWWLYVGDTGVGSYNIYSASQGTNTSKALSGLPTNGSTVYVRLWWYNSGGWKYLDYAYKACTIVINDCYYSSTEYDQPDT